MRSQSLSLTSRLVGYITYTCFAPNYVINEIKARDHFVTLSFIPALIFVIEAWTITERNENTVKSAEITFVRNIDVAGKLKKGENSKNMKAREIAKIGNYRMLHKLFDKIDWKHWKWSPESYLDGQASE